MINLNELSSIPVLTVVAGMGLLAGLLSFKIP